MSFILNHPVNKNRKAAALFEWVSWQCASRLVGGPFVVSYVNDSKLLVSRGMRGATGNIYAGLHEFSEMSFLLHFLRTDDLFIDVGANVGTYTVLAAKVCGAHCIAFEPDHESFKNLTANIKFNEISNRVRVYQIAISDHDGFVPFTTELGTENRILQKPMLQKGVVKVKTDTLDNILNNSKPTLIKIDVEGHQNHVINGAINTLATESLGAVIMEMNAGNSQTDKFSQFLHQCMRRQGLNAVSYSPFDRVLSLIDNDYSKGQNVIYVKNIDSAQKRLKTAPKFRVKNQDI